MLRADGMMDTAQPGFEVGKHTTPHQEHHQEHQEGQISQSNIYTWCGAACPDGGSAVTQIDDGSAPVTVYKDAFDRELAYPLTKGFDGRVTLVSALYNIFAVPAPAALTRPTGVAERTQDEHKVEQHHQHNNTRGENTMNKKVLAMAVGFGAILAGCGGGGGGSSAGTAVPSAAR